MKNEHRQIGSDLKLFNISESSSGMINWFPKGYFIFKGIESYIRDLQNKYNYHEVRSPIIGSSSLWEKSGHFSKFKENMFLLSNNEIDYAIKPMNCPFHIEIFQQICQSYKELPLRLSEFGLCHRNEPSGSLNGLLRLRSFNQDDGHIFCEKEQIKSELKLFVEMLYEAYNKFGFNKEQISVKISLRPNIRAGNDELWELAENYLMSGLSDLNIKYEILDGEGAFYGPKVEFSLKDSLKREWQCGTFQLDFILAERMDAYYINSKGYREAPVILHRAVLGSIERFIAILLEHYNGKLPDWLNPNCYLIIPINDSNIEYSKKIYKLIKDKGYAVVLNDSSDSVSYKLKNHFKEKGHCAIIIGDNEVLNNTVSLREKKSNKNISLNEFIEIL